MRGFRFAIALAAVSISAMSHAYLLQEWTKTIVTGTTNYANDVAIDNAGNVYVLGSGNAMDKSLFVTKIGPTGTTLWTKTYGLATATLRGFDIAVDGSGSVYFSYTTLSNTVFRKLRGSDGVILNDLVIDMNLPFNENRLSEILFDENGQMYLLLMDTGFATGAARLAVYNINTGAIGSSTSRVITLPQETKMLHAKARPGGGVIVLAGLTTEASSDARRHISNLYSFGPTGQPKVTPVGFASAFAVHPITDEVHTIGSSASFNRIYRQISPLDSWTIEGQDNSTDYTDVFLRDFLVTKSGIGMAVGGYHEANPNYYDSVYFRYPVTSQFLGTATATTTAENYQRAETIRADNFGTVTAVEHVTSTQIRVVELDSAYTGFIHSRSYTLPTNGPDICHAVSPSGRMAIASGDRVVVLKPRDLKDIYMGSTTLKGGLSATAIIRMYEPHNVQRTVTLSDDNAGNVTIAASRVFLAGETQISATVLTKAVTSNQVTTLSAKYGNQTRTFTFTVTP